MRFCTKKLITRFAKLDKNIRTQIPMKRAEAVKQNNDTFCTYYSERIFFNLVTDEKTTKEHDWQFYHYFNQRIHRLSQTVQ